MVYSKNFFPKHGGIETAVLELARGLDDLERIEARARHREHVARPVSAQVAP